MVSEHTLVQSDVEKNELVVLAAVLQYISSPIKVFC